MTDSKVRRAIVKALEKVQQQVQDSVDFEDGIRCDWTEEAYNRVVEIIEANIKEIKGKK